MEYKIQIQQFLLNLKFEWKLLSFVDTCYTCHVNLRQLCRGSAVGLGG